MHAWRRIMEFIVASGLTVPVIHHFVSPAVEKDQLILRCGSEVRGRLCVEGRKRGVDGLPACASLCVCVCLFH